MSYVLLRRQDYKPTDIPMTIHGNLSTKELGDILWSYGDIVAFDYETRGPDVSAEDFNVRSIAVCDGKRCDVFDFNVLNYGAHWYLTGWLHTKKLVAHNFVFDGAVLAWEDDQKPIPSPYACTYGLFRQLATEGFFNQSWSLKTLMTDILGWDNANTDDLDKWLTDNKLGKADMWQAPGEILLPYNGLDAIATWQAYEYFQTVIKDLGDIGKNLWEYHTTEWRTLNRVLISLKLDGITFNQEHHEETVTQVRKEVEELYQAFISMPEVTPHIEDYKTIKRAKHKAELEASPPKIMWKKDGTASATQLNWHDKIAKAHELEVTFNLKSSQQLQWLLYERMFDAKVISRKKFKIKGLDGVWREVPIPKKHKSAGFPTDKKSRIAMGAVGKALSKYKKVAVELSKLEKMPALVRADGNIHPDLRSVGTVTGRLSGKSEDESASNKFNLQNITKTHRTFACFTAPVGEALCYSDFSSLEPRVTAFYSKDDTLYELYARGKPHDVYLYNAGNISLWRDEVRKHYDMDNPTKESVKAAKAALVDIRNISKVVTLAGTYGAFPETLRDNINLAGNNISIEEAQTIYNDYWASYSGVIDFTRKLERMYKKNGGWIINGRGRPLTIDRRMTKDILNRFVQSTGHDLLLRYVHYLVGFITERELPASPFVPDIHDCTIWSIREDLIEDLRQCYDDAYDALNKELQWDIQMAGTTKVGYTYADFLED